MFTGEGERGAGGGARGGGRREAFVGTEGGEGWRTFQKGMERTKTKTVIGHGVADAAFSLNVVAKEWPIPHCHVERAGHGVAEPAFSIQTCWPRSRRSRILASNVVATEWPIPHCLFKRAGHGVAEPAFSLQMNRTGTFAQTAAAN